VANINKTNTIINFFGQQKPRMKFVGQLSQICPNIAVLTFDPDQPFVQREKPTFAQDFVRK
jgi:hypothetical protein